MTTFILLIAAWCVFLYLDLSAYRKAIRKDSVSWDEWGANRWRKLPGGGFYMLYKFRNR